MNDQLRSLSLVVMSPMCDSHSSLKGRIYCQFGVCGQGVGMGGQEEKGATEDELVGWHHRLNEHEFEQTLGGSEGQGSLVCCSPRRSRQESDTT